MLALAVVGASPVQAYHRKTPTLVQITPNGTGSNIANPRWAGFRYVVFDSDADLLGNNSTGRQVFYFDLQERDRTNLLSVHQLTSDNGDNQHGSTGSRAKVIAYDAQPGGAGPRQIMLVPRLAGAPWALTAGSADSINPVMDDGGRFVTFESQADLLGLGFTGSQVYLADLRIANPTCPYPCAPSNNAGLTQVTRKAGNSTHPVVSKAGVVAFESDADLLNAGQTENQIYVSDVFASQITRPTTGPGASQHPSMSKNGSFIAFDSAADLMGNGSTGTQVFVYKRKDSSLQQITNAAGAQSQNPSVELTGRGVLFDSNADLLNNGSTGPQIFEFTVAGATTRQVTDTGAGTSDPAHSAGVFTVFVSSADLKGNGSTGPQLYLVNLFALPFNSRVP
jgi:Tol biopolymer transport system component